MLKLGLRLEFFRKPQLELPYDLVQLAEQLGFHSVWTAEAYGADAPAARQEPLPAPTIPFAFTTFPGEIWRTPRSWVETCYPNVIYFNEVDKGGHFAAWEEPELFATEIRAAFRSLR